MASELTTIETYNVPLNNDYQHTFYFSNKLNQLNGIAKFRVKSYYNLSYQRKDNKIRIPEHIDNLKGINYISYLNADTSTKIHYAFVTRMEYVSEGLTDVFIETDVIQTYLFDYNVGISFVEREHVDDDTMGLHTIPEGLETGEYICNQLIRDENLRSYSYVMMVTEWTNEEKPLATNFNGVVSAGGAYVFENLTQLVNVVQEFSNKGKADAIIAVYMLPTKILEEKENDGTLQYSGNDQPVIYDIDINKQYEVDDYTPKNKKLLCYPYNYMLLSNNAGASNIIRYEHFSGDLCKFEVEGVASIGGSIKCVPKNYKGLERIQEEGIMCGKFPTLSWSADLFTNWLTQNAVNIGLGLVGGVAGTIGGAVTGNVMAIGGGVLSIAGTMGQIYQQELQPNSARGNVNSGDINTAYKMNTFYFYKMSIKKEYAKIIDKYFNMYGYKVNDLKVPNVNHRANYWFTKLIDANITGAIPKNDLNKIIECYNKGITFWKDTSKFRDYSVDNSITAG